MPSIPIPTQVPIERADWNNGFNPGGGMEGAAKAVGNPINPINVANDTATLQANNMLKGAQTAGAVQEVQQKQRQMQLSMLSGLDNIQDPEKRAAAAPLIIGMANKLNPSIQFDPNMDEATRKAVVMSGVPVGEQPQYNMMNQQAGLLGALRDRLAPAQGNIPVSGAQPAMGTASPQSPSAPTTAGFDAPTMALMAAVKPDMANALTNIQKTAYDSPEMKGESALNVKNADNLADSQKIFNATYSNLPLAMKRFQMLRDAAKNASYGTGSGGTDQYLANTTLGHAISPQTAAANQTIEQVANQGLISELAPNLQGMKPNKFLESISSKGNLINPQDRPEVKQTAVDNIQNQYIGMIKSNAAQRRAYGDKNVPTDAEIDAQVKQLSGPNTALPAHMQQGGQNTSALTAPEQLQSLDAARQAIANGAPRDAVIQRLTAAGITKSLLSKL